MNTIPNKLSIKEMNGRKIYKVNTILSCLVPRLQCYNQVLSISMAWVSGAVYEAITLEGEDHLEA
jgi:hypothetical protein